ncbi:MAG TPA: alanine racemase [Propionibacteriaceae bacterium]|nr:alanine racemase [Propionibacteriaceae bacterium]
MAEGTLPEAVGTWLWRGFPAGIDGLPTGQVAQQGWRVADLTTPIATLDRAALRHNQRLLDAWARDVGANLAPHVKTTMSPELMRLQLDAGAWALTAANPWQARVMAAAGAPRVLIANEVVSAELLATLLGEAEVWVFVDSPEAAAVVAEAGRRAGVVVPVILDIGFAGCRTGVRTVEAALAVAAAIDPSTSSGTGERGSGTGERGSGVGGVRLAGYGLFEGILTGERGPADLAKVRASLEWAVGIAEEVQRQLPVAEPVITGGGSMFPDLVAEVFGEFARRTGGQLVLRPGCYLIHDHGAYDASYQQAAWLDLHQALAIHTSVVSVPEPGLALLDAGKRDLALEGRPAPVLGITRAGTRLDHPDLAVTRSNDQHSYLEWDAAAWDGVQVDDRVRLGVSHPCVTMQLWRALPLLDGDRVVDAARTFF